MCPCEAQEDILKWKWLLALRLEQFGIKKEFYSWRIKKFRSLEGSVAKGLPVFAKDLKLGC